MSERPRAVQTQPLETLGLDHAERGVLAIARHYCVAFAEPRTEGWRMAIAEGLDRFGSETGPHLAVATLAVIQGLRESRQSPFSFNSPACINCSRHATPTERALLSVIRAARRGDLPAARAHALLLCEGNPPDTLVAAAADLASRLGALPAGRATGSPVEATRPS